MRLLCIVFVIFGIIGEQDRVPVMGNLAAGFGFKNDFLDRDRSAAASDVPQKQEKGNCNSIFRQEQCTKSTSTSICIACKLD